MPQSLKSRLKSCVEQGLLREEDLDRIIIVPNLATNGEMIRTVFPNASVDIKCIDSDFQPVHVEFETGILLNTINGIKHHKDEVIWSWKWWITNYKKGGTNNGHKKHH